MSILACTVCGALVEVDLTDVLTPRCDCGSGEIFPVNDDDDEQEGSNGST